VATTFDELTADAARTRTMLINTVQRPSDRTPVLMNTGVYHDEWRKTPEGWKLARRAIHHDRHQEGTPY
jgi:hypothetical protein